jgi:enamine deaminase RidA (YjgF/YER057c/UK114 family)
MELVTHRKFKGGRLMPWGKGTVVTGAKGFVYLCGNTATAADYDPIGKTGGGAVGDAHCSYNNPPPSEVIGIAALAHPDLVIEIVAVAALPD